MSLLTKIAGEDTLSFQTGVSEIECLPLMHTFFRLNSSVLILVLNKYKKRNLRYKRGDHHWSSQLIQDAERRQTQDPFHKRK